MVYTFPTMTIYTSSKIIKIHNLSMHVNKQHQLMIKNTVMEFVSNIFTKNTYTITNSTKYLSDKSTKIALVT